MKGGETMKLKSITAKNVAMPTGYTTEEPAGTSICTGNHASCGTFASRDMGKLTVPAYYPCSLLNNGDNSGVHRASMD